MKQYSIEKPRMISSAHGTLDRVLLVYPSGNKYPVDELLNNLLEHLPTYTKFLILVENQQETITSLQTTLDKERIDYFTMQSNLDQTDQYKNRKCCVIVSPPGHDYSIWVQDPFIVLKDGNSNDPKLFLLEPFGENKDLDSDHEIADVLAEHPFFESFDIPLIFHGGNILVGDSFFLIGCSHYYKTKEILKDSTQYSINMGLNELDVSIVFSDFLNADKKLIVVGLETGTDKSCSQPLYHIDTFMSLAGRNENGRYVVIVGNPIASDPSVQHLIGPLREQINTIARALSDKGFVVLRNPIPMVRKHINKGPYYPCLYNNVIIEITDNHKRVWLPTFAHDQWKDILSDYENENIQIWESLGYQVIQLMDFHPFIEHRGAVNCIVKQLERGINRRTKLINNEQY